MRTLLFALMLFPLLQACGPADDENYTPKPQAYYRIGFPEKNYKAYTASCPYSFDIPTYTIASVDSSRKDEHCWVNIDFPRQRARIYISYKPLHGDLNKYLEDTRTLVYKHTVKADDIEEKAFANPETKVYGTMYEIGGNAASSVQFFLTDSTSHFLRGSLYFNCPPNYDSLSPVIGYIKQDITHLMETTKWR